MTWQSWLFLAIPIPTGALAGRIVQGWAFAAGGVIASVLLLYAVPFLPQAAKPIVAPFVTGTGAACAALTLLLALNRTVGARLRVAVGTAAAFFAHLVYLSYALAVR